MATVANTRRSWLRPRFSLRVLLLAFTAFAIGFPIWWRWPYEEVEQLPSSFRGITPPVDEKRLTTWQRQWGGKVLKHGPERHLINGETQTETIYRDGKKHGPYVVYQFVPNLERRASGVITVSRKSEPIVTGYYVDDAKDGVWTYSTGGSLKTETWHDGVLVDWSRQPRQKNN